MKRPILLLIALGLLAAAAMAVLTTSIFTRLKAATRVRVEPKVAVLVAASKLEPMTVIDQSMVRVKTLPREQAPSAHYSDPVQATGRTLAVSMVEGQALTPGCFAPEGAGFELAAKLTPGMRAITVSLSYPASLKGFLYPGSIVDVLASFKFQPSQMALGEAVSTTLLQHIQILAVDDHTVGQSEGKSGKGELGTPGRQQCLVTLKVDSRQAEALQLASEYGTVSLVMRNPTDAHPAAEDPMLLSQGKLARMADIMSALVAKQSTEMAKKTEVKEVKEEKPKLAEKRLVDTHPRASEWQVDIYRGSARQTMSFPY